MKQLTFIEKLAAQSDLSQAQVRQLLVGMTKTVTALLKAGDDVVLPGIGRLGVRARAERQMRHIVTGDPITLPAAQVPTFKALKALKAALNVTV